MPELRPPGHSGWSNRVRCRTSLEFASVCVGGFVHTTPSELGLRWWSRSAGLHSKTTHSVSSVVIFSRSGGLRTSRARRN